FFAESDNESMPSPIKLQPKVSYCKTYEQIRLEEIQAESAAYYSYETSDFGACRNEADVGKAKRIDASRGGEWICVNPSTDTRENAAKELNFKVLSLEEIRQRKREKELAAEVELVATVSKPLVSTVTPTAKGTKRRSSELCDEQSIDTKQKWRRTASEIAKSAESIVKVPPVKLRRSLKSVIAAKKPETQSCESTPMDEERETTGSTQGDERACRERLENHGEESTNVNRRTEVEVRMCDSSTTEQKTQTQPQGATEDKKSVATYTTTEDILRWSALDFMQSVNSEEEYLRLDASSDDIMKDIEALLK
ncbi:hypothetical protein X777_04355, partial [Ooceraea biroi]